MLSAVDTSKIGSKT